MKRHASPEQAFDGLSEHYRRSRPDYPPEIVGWMIRRLGLRPVCRVADVGAGTGIFTRHLLRAGLRVCAVEISGEMATLLSEERASGDLRVIRGRAEALVAERNPDHRLGHRDLPVEEILRECGLCHDVERRVARRLWRLDHAGMIGFARSVSYIVNAMDGETLERFFVELRSLLDRHFPGGEVEIPLRCRAWIGKALIR